MYNYDNYDAVDAVPSDIPTQIDRRRNHSIAVRLTADEMKEVEKAAAAMGVPKGTYARIALIKMAREETQKAIFV